MKNIFSILLLVFSFQLFSQSSPVNETKVFNSLKTGDYVSITTDYPKTIVIKIGNVMSNISNVVSGDSTEDYETFYSSDDNYRIDFYKKKIVVFTNGGKFWAELYKVDLEKENTSINMDYITY